jgi:predicted CopG family antitoxin
MEKIKTIALRERTFNLLNELKKKKNAGSFDEIVLELVIERKNIKESMFGVLKGKAKPFTSEERKKIWEDKYRE